MQKMSRKKYFYLVPFLSGIFGATDKMTTRGNFLSCDFFVGNHSEVEEALANFGRVRDYFNSGSGVGPQSANMYLILSNLVASALNATLIGYGHPSFMSAEHPTVVPGLKMLDIFGRKVIQYWNNYYNSTKFSVETPAFIRIPDVPLNFAFCAIRKRKLEKFWNLSIFTHSFDFRSWFGLILALILVSFLEGSNFKVGKFYLKIFPNLAVLLTPGIAGKPRKFSLLFVLWMLVCLVVVNYYSGDMTSVLISPAPEVTLSKVEDLTENNYSLIFGEARTRRIVIGVVQALKETKYVPPEISIVSGMLISNDEKQPSIGRSLNKKFFRRITTEYKVAHLSFWPYASGLATRSNSFLGKEYPGHKKCHVGKELISAGESFYGFLPPKVAQMSTIFEHLVDSGIVNYMITEFMKLTMSQRVQDRGKIISPTQLVEEMEKVEELKMEGKTVTIFFLLGMCLCGSLVCFLCELLISQKSLHLKLSLFVKLLFLKGYGIYRNFLYCQSITFTFIYLRIYQRSK